MNKIAIIVGAAVLLAGGYFLGQSGQQPATVIKLDSEPKPTTPASSVMSATGKKKLSSSREGFRRPSLT